MEIPTTCDFCDLKPDEGEELVEIRFGDTPQPQPVRIEEYDSRYRHEENNEAQNRLLKTILSEHPSFEVTCHDMVEEVQPIDNLNRMGQGKPYSTQYDDEKVAVRVMFYPEPVESEPDALLCERCVENFSD